MEERRRHLSPLGRLLNWRHRRARRRIRSEFADWTRHTRDIVSRYGLESVSVDSDGETVVHTRYGVGLRYDPDIKRSVLALETGGAWEEQETRQVLEMMKGKEVFLDLGANTGWFGLVVAHSLPECSVHAFEPVPQTFELLKRNAEINQLANLKPVNAGLWDSPTELRFTNYRGPKNHITDDPNETRVDVVPCVTLDDYVSETGLDCIDLIKCDVEGTEMHFLRGAGETFRTLRPTLILESCDRYCAPYGGSARQVLELVTSWGYDYSVINDDGMHPSSGDMDRDIQLGYNFLFTPKD
jgi:FkbM family methyltransferase